MKRQLENALNNIKIVIGEARMTKREHIELEENIRLVEKLAYKGLEDKAETNEKTE